MTARESGDIIIARSGGVKWGGRGSWGCAANGSGRCRSSTISSRAWGSRPCSGATCPRATGARVYVYFLALLVQSLIEREFRRGIKQAKVEELALYPEERTSRRPTAEQIFRLFSLAQRSILLRDGAEEHVFEPELTKLQTQVLTLLGVPLRAYRRH